MPLTDVQVVLGHALVEHDPKDRHPDAPAARGDSAWSWPITPSRLGRPLNGHALRLLLGVPALDAGGVVRKSDIYDLKASRPRRACLALEGPT